MGLEEFVLDRAKRMGLQEGIEQGKQLTGYEKDFAFVKNLLLQTDFSIEKIASLVGTDIDFVMKVKELV